jgi:signal transduction histidine kinase
MQAGDLLESVAQRFENRATSLGRELNVEPSELVLDADPIRLEQALANLVENALTYGGGAVQLGAVEQTDAVELHVIDEGEGFPQEFRSRAFDRFSRADEARGRGGSGLGLSIVELVARAHGGEVGLCNRPEGGADVWLSLPRNPTIDPAREQSLALR